jgi:hypothetical protein
LRKLKLLQEQQLAEIRVQQESERAQSEFTLRQQELEIRRQNSESQNSNAERFERETEFRSFNLSLPKFDNNGANLQGFLTRFETLATVYRLPVNVWSLELSKCLDGVSLQVFESLSAENRLSYDALKCALNGKFQQTEGTFRKLFHTAKTNPLESQTDFAQRLKDYLQNWLKYAGYEQTYENLETLLVKNNFFKSQPKPVQIFLKEHGSGLSLDEMVKLSESYRDAHGIIAGAVENDHGQAKSKFVKKYDKPNNDRKFDSANSKAVADDKTEKHDDKQLGYGTRKCYGCGSTDHVLKNCNVKNKGFQAKKSAACNVLQQHASDNFENENVEMSVKMPNGQVIPYVATVDAKTVNDKMLPDLTKPHKGQGFVNSHKVRFVRDTGSNLTIVKEKFVKPDQLTGKTVTCMLADGCVKSYPLAEIEISTPYYEGIILAASIPTAMHDLLIGNDYLKVKSACDEMSERNVKTYNGPFIFENSKMNGKVETKSIEKKSYDRAKSALCENNSAFNFDVEIHRDQKKSDGNAVHIDKIANVNEISNELNIACSISVDRNVPEGAVLCDVNVKAPDIEIMSHERMQNGNLTVLCDELKTDELTLEVATVQTRSQSQNESKPLKPLKLTKFDALNLTVVDFKKMQQADPNLKKYWDLAKDENNVQTDDKIRFVVQDEILYRVYTDDARNKVVKQLLIPEQLVDKVIAYAHESLLSGHCSIAKTIGILIQEFWFYSMQARVKRWVKSCDLCQRGSNRNVGRKAPMFSMPIVKDAFDTVYIDIVGEIKPCSVDGHRYILTIMCAATRFPIAVALKKVDSVTIAEALMEQFNLFGHPRLVISDNGANLTSDLIKEANRLYGIKMHKIPVYRPQANSILERSHAVLHSILRKLTVEQPKMWHRYLSPLLFAMRSTPNVSGFSSFELMFGRDCRTHLSLLKDLWTNGTSEPETKTVYQYVLDMRERIEQTCDLARREYEKIQTRNQKRVNARAKLRVFQPGDKVLVLVMNPRCKLDFVWQGPAEVLERRGVVNYRIRFDNGMERTYHVNMIKLYITRDAANNQTSKHDEVEGETLENDKDPTNENVGDAEEIAAVMGVVEDSDNESDDNDENDRIVKESGKMELYNLTQKETWRDVDINPDLEHEVKSQLWKLVQEYGDIFSDVPTVTNVMKHKIELTSDIPVSSKPYKIPIHLQDAVDGEIQTLLKHGWIERCTSEYASPIVVVKKKNSNDIRLCVSYKAVNDIMKDFPQPMPEIDDILAKVGPAKIFTTVDMCKGYYAIELDEQSRDYTSFVTPNDMYRFKVLPFGLKTAGAAYCNMLRRVLHDAVNMQNFIDDVIAYDQSIDAHVHTLRDLFQRIRNANLKIKPSKTKIGYFEVQFLGHIVSQGQIKPTTENVEKVLNAPVPKTKSGVRSLCGTVGFIRKFVPNCAKWLKPLHDLTGNKCGDSVNWTDKHQKALDHIKSALTTQPVLKIYDPKRKHVLQCDASDDHIGGVLLQEEDDGLLHPVIYVSRKLLDREMRYHIGQKEMLGIVWACSRLYKYFVMSIHR